MKEEDEDDDFEGWKSQWEYKDGEGRMIIIKY